MSTAQDSTATDRRMSSPRRLTVLGIVGSLRRESYNRKLYNAAKAESDDGIEWVDAELGDVPVYNGDVEASEGFPDAVMTLKRQAMEADAILLVSPEYNHSVPGMLKNTIDWMSRRDELPGPVFAGKPLGLMGASNGVGGTRHSQMAWLPVLRHLKVVPYFGSGVWIASAGDVFDESGKFTDGVGLGFLRSYIAGFEDFIRLHGA